MYARVNDVRLFPIFRSPRAVAPSDVPSFAGPLSLQNVHGTSSSFAEEGADDGLVRMGGASEQLACVVLPVGET